MKKVLGISSSPRRGGNSDLLCDEFLRGAKEAGNIVYKAFLRDFSINFCRGCGACTTTRKCVQKDDMAGLLEKLISADVIVLATPVYYYAPDGQMKTFIDRTCPKWKEIVNKEFYYIAAGADSDPKHFESVFECLRGFTVHGVPGAREMGTIAAADAWTFGDVNGTEAMRQAYDYGKNA